MTGDERRRQLPLASDDLSAIPLEGVMLRARGTQLLALGDELLDVPLDSADFGRLHFHGDIYDAAGQQPAAPRRKDRVNFF
jgi:hypothetical protein